MAAAARAAMAAPCQRKCSSAQPRAKRTGGEKPLIGLSIAMPHMPVENAAKFFDFLGRGAAAGQGMHHQLTGGAFKNPLNDIRRQLAFGLFRRTVGAIDMGALAF